MIVGSASPWTLFDQIFIENPWLMQVRELVLRSFGSLKFRRLALSQALGVSMHPVL